MNILFNLSSEDIRLSKRIFNNKIVRIIVSNGVDLSKLNEQDKTIIFFPENSLSINDINKYVEEMCNNIIDESLIIVTNSFQIITAAPKCLCRKAKYKENVVCFDEFNDETLAQNLFNILYEFTDQSMSSTAYNFINIIIQKLKDNKTKYTAKEKEQLRSDILLIGEQIIRSKLLQMLNELK